MAVANHTFTDASIGLGTTSAAAITASTVKATTLSATTAETSSLLTTAATTAAASIAETTSELTAAATKAATTAAATIAEATTQLTAAATQVATAGATSAATTASTAAATLTGTTEDPSIAVIDRVVDTLRSQLLGSRDDIRDFLTMSNQTAATTAAVDTMPDISVAFVEEAPFITAENNGEDWEFKGFIPDLLDKIQQQIPGGINFTYQKATDNVHGTSEPGGWTGIVGDIVSGKAGMGVGLTVTPAREKVIDFTNEYMDSTVNLLVKKPTFYDLGLGYLVRPLSTDMWIMILVLILLVGLVFAFIGKFNPYEWGNVAAEKDPRGARNAFSLRNSYLFMFSSLTWQGFREAPRSYTGRVMAAFWWIFVLFTLIAYTANLTAYMLARPEQMPELPFKTYEDLLTSPIDVGMLKFGATQDGLRRSHNPSLKEIYVNSQKQRSAVESYQEGIENVKNSDGDYVLFMDFNSAEYAARQNCELMIYGIDILPGALAFGFPEGSFWTAKFNSALRTLKIDGTLDKLRDKYWRFAGECENVDGRKYSSKAGMLSSSNVYPISLKDMAVAILLVFLGFLVAMIIFIAEYLHYAVTKKGKKIERPAVLKNRPKIFRPKGKGAAKPVPTSEEGAEGEAGPSSDGLESVPLDDTVATSSADVPEEGAKEEV